MTHEIENFERDIIERSRVQPVLVDFWAEWCGPCRTLGPILEKLEREAGGAWRLAKVDVDRNRALAARYGVQGIPAVKLFVDGAVVAEFTGALPESQVARWLEAQLPSEDRAALESAVALAGAGQTEQAVAELERLLEAEPASEAALVVLAQLLLFSDPARAANLASRVPSGSDYADAAADVRVLSEALRLEVAALTDSPARADYAAGLSALAEGDLERALDRMIASIARHRAYTEESARKVCIALFHYLGREHPLSQRYRRAFQSALN